MTIEESIVARLLAAPAVAAVLGTRVYPDGVPQQCPPGPRAEVDLTDQQQAEQLDGYGGGSFAATVTVYAQRKPAARAAADAVRDALDGYTGGEIDFTFWGGTAAAEAEAGYAYAVEFAGRYLGRQYPAPLLPAGAVLFADSDPAAWDGGDIILWG